MKRNEKAESFFRQAGLMAIGSRLRLLTEQVTSDAARIYELYGADLRPKWFPVFFALAGGAGKSVTALAREIGHTHPSVSNILKEMKEKGLVRFKQSKADGRQAIAVLTSKGIRLAGTMDGQYDDVERAVERLGKESGHDLWAALADWERLLGQKGLWERVAEEKLQREQDEVQVVRYDDGQHHEAFRQLNEEWISDLFGVVEEQDHYELDHPVEHIVKPGGYIFIALLRGKPVGTFAMMPCQKEGYDFELVKFAVSPSAQGHGIGSRLIETCLRQARRAGGFRLFIESNWKCAAAVHLYEKYGFRHLDVKGSDYARCDVQMEKELA